MGARGSNSGNSRAPASGGAGAAPGNTGQFATDTSSGDGGNFGGGGAGAGENHGGQATAGGGTGGGGNSGQWGQNHQAGQAGQTNTGGGGGGGSSGGAGGSGIVIVRTAEGNPAFSATTGSPSTVTANGYDYYKFTGSGSFTV